MLKHSPFGVPAFIFNLIDIHRLSSLRSKSDIVDKPSLVSLKQQPASSAEYLKLSTPIEYKEVMINPLSSNRVCHGRSKPVGELYKYK